MNKKNPTIEELQAILDSDMAPLPEPEPRTLIRPTIDELEKLLNGEDNFDICINPDGSVTATPKKEGEQKPLTMRQSLGGEYCQ